MQVKRKKACVYEKTFESYEEVIEYIIFQKDFEHFVYLEGDFSQSYKEAMHCINNRGSNGYDGEYNLLKNNCLHFITYILSEGQSIYPAVNQFISNYTGIIPINFYKELSAVVYNARASTKQKASQKIIRGDIGYCCLS